MTKAPPDIPFELPKVSRKAKQRAGELLELLRTSYPGAACELNYHSPHELLVATILSAQATDVGVNRATPALFKRFPTPADFAAASPADIEPYIKSIGLFRNKARSIHAAMSAIVSRFGGQVPQTMAELLELQGVARKTANVVLGNAFNINCGFVVDTHVQRLAGRLNLAPAGSTVAMIERYLMALFPQDAWCETSHLLIWHGRRACTARLAECSQHPVCRQFGACCELERHKVPGRQTRATATPNKKRAPRPSTPRPKPSL